MSLIHSPQIITNGLVFAYDTSNIHKSFKGGPGTNLVNSGPWTVGGSNIDVTNTNEAGPISGATTWKLIKTGTSNQWNGWEANYGVFNFTAGEYIAISYWYNTVYPAGLSGFTQGNIVVSDWSRSLNFTLISNKNSIIADGQWRYNYCVMQVNETYSGGIVADGPSWNYSTLPGIMYICGLTWSKTAYPMQFVNGTRSTTQVVLDMVGGNTLTANSLTYNSDGTFNFNGSNDKITLSANNVISGTMDYTLEATIRLTDTGGVDYIFGNYGSGNSSGIEWYVFQNKLNNYIGGNTQSNTSLVANQWYHVCTTRNAGLVTHYLNGVPDGSSNNGNSIGTNNPYTIGNGHDYTSESFNGKIDTVKVYNRALTALEVKQNFNAIRGRYGI